MVASRLAVSTAAGGGVRSWLFGGLLLLVAPGPVVALDSAESHASPSAVVDGAAALMGTSAEGVASPEPVADPAPRQIAGPPAPVVYAPLEQGKRLSVPARAVRLDAALVGLGQVADIVSTEIALARPGLREGNPLVENRAVRIPLKLGVAAAVTLACRELRKRDRPGPARALAIVGFALGAAATVHNTRMSRQHQ